MSSEKGERTDRRRFQYASIMRQVGDAGPDEADQVCGFHGKEPESTIKKFIVDGELVAAKYERLELIEFGERMSDADINEWFVENEPLDKWADEDGYYQPEEARP